MKSLSQLLKDWRESQLKMNKLVEDIPRIIGVESVKIVKDNFKLQGYDTGIGVSKWKERKPATNKAYSNRKGTYKGTVYNANAKILMQQMNLFNSVDKKVMNKSVTIGCDRTLVPYAQRHNEGLKGMPKRQFMPSQSEIPNLKMLRAYTKKIGSERELALRNFKR